MNSKNGSNISNPYIHVATTWPTRGGAQTVVASIEDDLPLRSGTFPPMGAHSFSTASACRPPTRPKIAEGHRRGRGLCSGGGCGLQTEGATPPAGSRAVSAAAAAVVGAPPPPPEPSPQQKLLPPREAATHDERPTHAHAGRRGGDKAGSNAPPPPSCPPPSSALSVGDGAMVAGGAAAGGTIRWLPNAAAAAAPPHPTSRTRGSGHPCKTRGKNAYQRTSTKKRTPPKPNRPLPPHPSADAPTCLWGSPPPPPPLAPPTAPTPHRPCRSRSAFFRSCSACIRATSASRPYAYTSLGSSPGG